jgi:PAT family beta-lactamase induction signal transducer AmpG
MSSMSDENSAERLSWREAITVYLHPQVLVLLLLGFSAGLPFLLVFSTLSAWLTEAQVTRSAIGLFSWVGITYSIKVFWAPVIDRLPFPILTRLLGKRRGWMLLAQLGIVSGLLGMAASDPRAQLFSIAMFALLVAFSSATQDITIDAYRIEVASRRRQAALAAAYIFGYRIALLVAGAGAFYIAEYTASWSMAYISMAVLMGIGILTVLLIREPEHIRTQEDEAREKRISEKFDQIGHIPSRLDRLAEWFSSAVISPFVEFFQRNGSLALAILVLIGVFRLSDITMGVMANPFYLDLGFSKTQIANIAKIFGFFMTIGGSALGGVLVMRYGLMGPLLLSATLVSVTNLLFAFMASTEPTIQLLAVVISADNLSGGLANAVFIAYLSSLTNRAYTATQYALFSSLMTLPGKFIGGFSGFIVEGYGYTSFFIYAALVGVPAILLVVYLWRNQGAVGRK